MHSKSNGIKATLTISILSCGIL